MSEIKNANDKSTYWRANLQVITILLSVWFLVSFGAGIIFVDALNQVEIAGFKLGFWFAQQGAIYTFIVLIFIYVAWMRHIDQKFGVADDNEPDSYDLIDNEGEA